MRQTYHMCIASHDEVMCRNEEDLIHAFNALAIASVATESRLLGEGIMSDHIHFVVQTDDIKEVSTLFRNIYSRYFNNKYERRGRFGEKYPFILEVEGVKHITTALSYVLRQALHHGIYSTPFGYKHCSANIIFMKELGKSNTASLIPNRTKHTFIPRAYQKTMDAYRMGKDGLFFREDIIDTAYVEELYITPRNFLYQMNRLSSEEWEREQLSEDPKSQVVNIQAIEYGYTPGDIEKMLTNESGRIDTNWMNDIELCSLIDKTYLPKFHPNAVSIYSLSIKQRESLASKIQDDLQNTRRKTGRGKYITQTQLIRCLALNRRT